MLSLKYLIKSNFFMLLRRLIDTQRRKELKLNHFDPVESVTEFIEENQQSLYRLAYSYVKNSDDAMDIVQDSIYKALKSVYQLKQPQFIKTWMYKIVIHTALDFLKRNKHNSYVDIDSLQESGENDCYPDFDVQNLMNSLAPQYKTVIILRFFEDMKLEDIAKIQNVSLSTVKTRLYTALKKLKVQLEKGEYYEIHFEAEKSL